MTAKVVAREQLEAGGIRSANVFRADTRTSFDARAFCRRPRLDAFGRCWSGRSCFTQPQLRALGMPIAVEFLSAFVRAKFRINPLANEGLLARFADKLHMNLG